MGNQRIHIVPAAQAAHVVEELVSMFDAARDAGAPQIVSLVGSKLEGRARAALDALFDAGIEAEPPPVPKGWRP